MKKKHSFALKNFGERLIAFPLIAKSKILKKTQPTEECDQEMLDKLFRICDYPWLREFAKCAPAEAVLLVAKEAGQKSRKGGV